MICCYDDAQALVSASAEKAGRLYDVIQFENQERATRKLLLIVGLLYVSFGNGRQALRSHRASRLVML